MSSSQWRAHLKACFMEKVCVFPVKFLLLLIGYLFCLNVNGFVMCLPKIFTFGNVLLITMTLILQISSPSASE